MKLLCSADQSFCCVNQGAGHSHHSLHLGSWLFAAMELLCDSISGKLPHATQPHEYLTIISLWQQSSHSSRSLLFPGARAARKVSSQIPGLESASNNDEHHNHHWTFFTKWRKIYGWNNCNPARCNYMWWRPFWRTKDVPPRVSPAWDSLWTLSFCSPIWRGKPCAMMLMELHWIVFLVKSMRINQW